MQSVSLALFREVKMSIVPVKKPIKSTIKDKDEVLQQQVSDILRQ